MRKINLLHLIAHLPQGGAENIFYTIAKNIDKNKYNLLFCCLDGEGEIAEKIKAEGFKVICLRQKRERYFYRQLLCLYKLFKEEKIDIVHVHLFKSDFWGRLIACLAGVPVICKTEHSVRNIMALGIWNKWISPFYNIMRMIGLYRFLDWRTDGLVYNTRYSQRSFFGDKVNPEKHFIIPGTAAKEMLSIPESREALRERLGFSKDDFIIIIVARLIERKGHKYLIEAFAGLSPRFSRMKLVIVGIEGGADGRSSEKILKELAAKLGVISKTIFTGNVLRSQEYIKMSDILVLPSWEEALGLVILEAMCLGVPVIGSNNSGIAEVIEDGVNGYLVKTKNSGSIEEAILKIYCDPRKTGEITENAKKKFDECYTESAFINKYENMYESLLRKKGIIQ